MRLIEGLIEVLFTIRGIIFSVIIDYWFFILIVLVICTGKEVESNRAADAKAKAIEMAGNAQVPAINGSDIHNEYVYRPHKPRNSDGVDVKLAILEGDTTVARLPKGDFYNKLTKENRLHVNIKQVENIFIITIPQ